MDVHEIDAAIDAAKYRWYRAAVPQDSEMLALIEVAESMRRVLYGKPGTAPAELVATLHMRDGTARSLDALNTADAARLVTHYASRLGEIVLVGGRNGVTTRHDDSEVDRISISREPSEGLSDA